MLLSSPETGDTAEERELLDVRTVRNAPQADGSQLRTQRKYRDTEYLSVQMPFFPPSNLLKSDMLDF